MGTPREHVAESDRNGDRARQLSGDPWEIVLLFYSSLHLVKAYLATKAVHFQANDHVGISKAIDKSPELKAMRQEYARLRKLSENVRYDPAFKPAQVDLDDARAFTSKISAIVRSKVERWIKQNP